MSRWDEDTRVEAIGEGRFAATITDNWTHQASVDGGYVHGIALRALQATLPHPDPVTSTGHFLAPAQPGPVEVDVATLRIGGRHSTGVATVRQEGQAILQVTATCGDLSAAEGPTVVAGEPPALPAIEDCVPSPSDADQPPLLHQVDERLDPATVGWLRGEPSGEGRIAGWFRFRDGSDVDVTALALVVDAFVPAVFELGFVGWTPTLELTVHVRGRPAPGWLRVATRTRYLIDGYAEEEAVVWDASDRLVAMARQLALVREAPAGAT